MTQRNAGAHTPIAFVQAIAAAYERYGVNPDGALDQAQIAPSLLWQPEARITATQMEVLSAAAMQELDDEALGWFARKLPWGSYGMLCRASLSAPTLGIALQRWCRHHRLLTEDILLTLHSDGATATLAIEERTELGALREFCLVSSLRYAHGYACWLIDSRLSLQQASFPFAAPAHHDVYPLLFPGPVLFGAPRAGFSFDARYLALPMHRDEPELQRMLQNALLLTVRQYRRDRLVAQRIRNALVDDPATGINVNAMAAHLHVSPRTLHRQLHEEGITFQQIKDETRRDRALHLLGRTQQPIKQVATACGFQSEKSFARAFRLWTGLTPSACRGGALPA
jgi:AraC-like DNA-binding protein